MSGGREVGDMDHFNDWAESGGSANPGSLSCSCGHARELCSCSCCCLWIYSFSWPLWCS